jgi:two-component system chemotaxis response regulator CheY
MAKLIMTVDDSASVRQMVAFTIKQNGYEVIEAVDGQDALAKLATQKVDMLLTDLNMPKLDGIGLIKGVRGSSLNRFIPIIMLTTESQDSMKAAGKAAGASGWIVKPFKPEQLVGVIKKLLG